MKQLKIENFHKSSIVFRFRLKAIIKVQQFCHTYKSATKVHTGKSVTKV